MIVDKESTKGLEKMRKLAAVLIGITGFSLSGCAANNNAIKKPSDFPGCGHLAQCSASGLFSIVDVDHVMMGKIELADGKCVNVSLPDTLRIEILRDQREYVGKYLEFAGILRPTPGGEENTQSIKVEGRSIGWHQCADSYIFMQ